MKTLNLGNLKLPAAEAVSRASAILAMRGAGKSNAAVVMAEEMYAAGSHWVAIDPKGDWWGIRSSRDGKGPGLPVVIFGGDKGDVALEPGGGAALADFIVSERLTCVVDVSQFTEGEKVRFLGGAGKEEGFAMALYRRKKHEQDPTHLFLEEAHDYIPQQPRGEKARLVDAFGKIVTMGRNRGLGVTMITQRSARLHKDVLTQVDTMIVLRIVGPQDRDAIAGWLKYHGQSDEILASLSSLADGEAWLWSPEWLGETKRFQFRRRSTFDSGSTPVGSGSGRKPATLADVDLAAVSKRMSDAIVRAKEANPLELRKRIATLERELAAAKKPTTAAAPAISVLRVDKPVFRAGEVDRLLAAAKKMEDVVAGPLKAAIDTCSCLAKALTGKIDAAAQSAVDGWAKAPAGKQEPTYERALPVSRPQMRAERTRPPLCKAADGVTGVGQKILDALAELEQLGSKAAPRSLAAFLAGYTHTQSKGFVNGLSSLSTAGFIVYGAGTVSLTATGRDGANFPPVPSTSTEIQERICALLGGASARILQPLIGAYPGSVPRADVAAAAGYGHVQSKGFVNALSRLRTLGFIDYRDGHVVAQPILFLEGER